MLMQTRTTLLNGALVGLCITASLLALLSLGNAIAGLPFYPYDGLKWLSRELPGDVVTTGIDVMVDTLIAVGLGEDVDKAAKTSERLMAIAGFLLLGIILGAFYFWFADRSKADKNRDRALS